MALGNRLLVLGELNINAGEVSAAVNVLGLDGGDVNVGDATLIVSGNVPRTISMQDGADPYTSIIRASGPTQLGDAVNGYNFDGTLDVADQPVSVHGTAGTPPVVTIALLDGGTLSGSPELKVAGSTGIIYGTGLVTGTVHMGEEPNPPLLISGIDGGQRLEFSGLVRGVVSSPAFVDFTGYGPTGWSPSYSSPRGSYYAKAVFWIEGNVPWRMESDRTEEGHYTQFQVLGDPDGPGAPTRFDSLELREYGDFEWSDLEPGDLWLIFTAPARLVDGFPPKATDLQGGCVKYGDDFLSDLENQLRTINLELIPLGKEMRISQWDEFGLTLTLVPDILTVVPEPGTLVLLLSGGLGLLFLVWRRRRRS